MAAFADMEELINSPGLERLADPWWRITSGELYKITVKDENDEDDEGFVMPFKPNRAQIRFMKRWWNRNIILKARQLGFTTLICLLWLDYAMFNANASCGVIAQTDEAATKIFKSKVLFAYENLPDALREAMPLKEQNAHELAFAHNNSSIRVATSMRSGTIHRLLVSEFGKICAKFPHKAEEVITGSIPAVPLTGICIIESTAEGQEGSFYTMTQSSLNKQRQGKLLNPRDWRFHFFAWFEDVNYRMDPMEVVITPKDHEDFEQVEQVMKVTLDMEQRAWYVATRNDLEESGQGEKMLQEYPSTPEEAFQRSVAGTYYAKEMAAVRKSGRICNIPQINELVYTFWDVGASDGTAIWFMQKVGMEYRLIKYYENHGEHLSHYVKYLHDTGYIFGGHLLPHDAAHERLSSDENKSIQQQLEDLKVTNITIVPKISDLGAGIQLVRKHFKSFYFDEVHAAEGIKRIDGYKKKFNRALGRHIDVPEKQDGNSEGADALRQLAQAIELDLIGLPQYTSSMGNRPATPWQTN